MKNFEVHELVDGWTGQANTLREALTMRDHLQENDPDCEVKIMAEVDESDLND